MSAPSLPQVIIIGRPNVGKSTLFNRMIGEDRSVVHDLAGTTRDAVDTILETEFDHRHAGDAGIGGARGMEQAHGGDGSIPG